MADVALYRKYRSADFSEVVGQDHVVKTLQSAIASGRLSHAYLFTGPRGVGKTSVARLLARALNCTSDKIKPCNQCASCKAALNSSLDIIEIDAASNRSIDAVRELRDKIGLAPSMSAYKVYIIDEVHMLTTEAFNALLKTLEEPPAHAVFILATTEAHKLPATIVSRTQAFSFRPISTTDIVSHLGSIAKTEKIEVEPAALELIATAARGGFRDAISMFDQMMASGERPITALTVRALLGYSDTEAVSNVSRAIVAYDVKAALKALGVLVDQGAQPGQVVVQLADQWRAVLHAAASGAKPDDEVVAELAAGVQPARAAQVVETILELSRSHWPQLALEAAVVRLAVEPEAAAVPVASPSPVREVARPNPAATPVRAAVVAPVGEVAATGDDARLWPKVLVILKAQSVNLATALHMYEIDFQPTRFIVKSRFNYHRDVFNRPVNRQAIEAAVRKVYGREIAIEAVLDESAVRPAKATVDPNADLVSSALEILGGEVVE